MRTKRKQKNEANDNEADELIQDYIDNFNRNSNLRTQKILKEYIEQKEKLIKDE